MAYDPKYLKESCLEPQAEAGEADKRHYDQLRQSMAADFANITEKKERLRSTHYEEVSQTFREASKAGVEFWEIQMDFRPEGVTLYSVTRSKDL